jgi:FG-GAP repeat protein
VGLDEQATWRQLHPFEVTHLAVGDLDGVDVLAGGGVDDLIADFPGYGLWVFRNNTTWTFLHGLDVATMTTSDLDNDGKADLVASFPTYGIWIFRNNSTWTPLHPFTASAIAVGQLDDGAQADLVIDFGAWVGIWTYTNSATWTQLHDLSSTALAVADFDGDGRDEVAIGFAGSSVWRYSAVDASPWTCLNGNPVSALAASRIH